MRNKVLLGVIGVVAIISIIYSLSGGQTEEQFAEEITKHRDETDRFMRNSDESPFLNNLSSYHELNYYPPRLKYKVKARFQAVEKPEIMILPTSDNKEKQYLTYGYASFELNGKQNKLLILENVEDESLFLAFGDNTSAVSTYGAGRYLDVEHNGGPTITLDFNKAYNPYCAYSENYSCPFPPKQNLLDVAIEAGEKNYKEE